MKRPLSLPLLLAVLLPVVPLPVIAGTGAAELQLDRGAVGALLQAHLPSRVGVALPPLGKITLALAAPDPVTFLQGALETTLRVEIVEAKLSGRVTVRLVPEVDADGETIVFRPTRAQPTGDLAGLPDLAPLLPRSSCPASSTGSPRPTRAATRPASRSPSRGSRSARTG